MAIDFSQVKTITIPEGSVKKITDSNGNILWKEKSAEWHTIWEGNETGGNPIYLNELSGQVTLRVTWSCTASGGDSSYKTTYFNNNGWANTTATKPDSPFQFDLNTGSTRKYIVGVKRYDSYNTGGSSSLDWYYRSSAPGSYFYISNGHSSGGSDVRVSMTVTKIEQYY